jgi:hypothetical protein
MNGEVFVVACFNIPFRHLLVKTKYNLKNLSLR